MVTHEELAGSPKINRERSRISATRQLRVAWADRFTLANELLGISGTTSVPPPPHELEIDNGTVSGCVARNVAIMGLGVPLGEGWTEDAGNVYTHAQLDVEYRTPEGGGTNEPPDPTDGAIYEEEFIPDQEIFTAEAGQYYFGNSGGDRERLGNIPYPIKRVAAVRWEVQVYNMLAVPAGIFSLIGSVNDREIRIKTADVDIPAECIMYLGGSPRRALTSTTATARWDVRFSFAIRSVSWNKFWRASNNEMEAIYNQAGSEQKPFEPINFLTALNIRYGA